MGYYVRALPLKQKEPKWKVQFVSYKKSDSKHSQAKKPKKEWDVPHSRFRALGFFDGMDLPDARTRARQLNSQLHIKRQEERLKTIAEAEKERRCRADAVLPAEFVDEFEARFIRAADAHQDSSRRIKRAKSIWRAAQKLIVSMGIEPSDWFLYQHEIYDHLSTKHLSLRYLHAILRFANLWGFYVCKKLGRPFLPIPYPRGFECQRLLSAFYEKSTKARKPSKPLSWGLGNGWIKAESA